MDSETLEGPLPDCGEKKIEYMYQVKLLWDAPGVFGCEAKSVVASSAIEAFELVAGKHVNQITYAHIVAIAPKSYELLEKPTTNSRYRHTGLKEFQ